MGCKVLCITEMDFDKDLSPIVLFVYNRPWHTQQTVEALQNNELAKNSELFIYADNAKNDMALEEVQAVRKYIHTIKGFKKITIIERDKNWGLADSIIDGVTSIVNKYGKIIVMEDDIVTSPYFLRYMNDALDFYQNKTKVMHVSGYIYPIDNSNLNDTFFIKPDTCWGWATWARAWKFFKKDTDFYIEKFDKKMIKDFNLNNSYDYFRQIKQNKTGKINTWAIYWYASMYLNNGLALHSKNSFVKNIGHDDSGEHCGAGNYFDVDLITKYPIHFTKEIAENLAGRNELACYYRRLKRFFLIRVINKLLRMSGIITK